MLGAPVWIEVLGYLGAGVLGCLLTLAAILYASIRRARKLRVAGPRTRLEVIRRAGEGAKLESDERARRVVQMWTDQADRLDPTDAERLLDYNRRMVEEVAAAYQRDLTDLRVSRAARRVARLLSDDLRGPLAALDRFFYVTHFTHAHRALRWYQGKSKAYPQIEPTLLWANRFRQWATRAYRVANLAIPQLLFYEAAWAGAVHFGKRYVREEMGELTEKVGIAAMEIYGEALVERDERALIEASLLLDLLVRMARVGGLTPEKDMLLERFMKREAGNLERVEDLYARFREEIGRSEVEGVASLLELEPERERSFFAMLEELAAANPAGSRDRRRADELLAEIRSHFERGRAEREQRTAAPLVTLPEAPAEPAGLEAILAELIDEDTAGEEIALLAERGQRTHEDPLPEVLDFFENEANFFRALHVERFRVSSVEAECLIPRLARVVAAVRLYSTDRRAHRDQALKVFRDAARAPADADANAFYEEMRRAVLEPGRPGLWSLLARAFTGDPRTELLPTKRILAAARRLAK